MWLWPHAPPLCPQGLPEDKRDESLTRAIYIGVLAMKEDRLAAFLAKTQNELGTELEHLKQIFDLKQQLFVTVR